jgi:hypothetical protein
MLAIPLWKKQKLKLRGIFMTYRSISKSCD